MIKKFLEWIGLKEKLHINSSVPLYFNEGEIWWCAVGENIGCTVPLSLHTNLVNLIVSFGGQNCKLVG